MIPNGATMHPTILVVCEGNICRSPYVERTLLRRLRELGVTDVSVCSAGTRAAVGAHMDDRSRRALIAEGSSAAGFVPTTLERAIARRPALVLTLERAHRGDLLEIAPGLLRKTFTLREFARLIAAAGDVAGTTPTEVLAAMPVAAAAARRAGDRVDDDDVADPVLGDDTDHAAFRQRVGGAIETIATLLARAPHPAPSTPDMSEGASR
jgi:protein-tyrosine phosphatase